MDRANPAHRHRDKNDAVIEMIAANPVHQPRDRDDAVIEITVAIHPHCHHRDDQTDGTPIPVGPAGERGQGRRQTQV